MEFKLNNKLKVSVLVANYNNQKYISQCIKSIINQKYKNIEIIFHDDCSQDNSIKEIKNFKKIKIIKNKKKTITGSFNQLAAYKRMFKISKGEIIFFLDSDDYFHRDKVYNVIKKYISNPKLKAIFDLPILKYNNKQNIVKNKKKIIKNFWPYIPPQSCISVRRNELNKIFKHIHFNKFPDIWMDFRIGIYLKHTIKKFFILENNLTYYRKTSDGASSKYKFLSKNWWKRRWQAHEYVRYYFKINNIIHQKNLDFYLTYLITKIM